MFKTLRSAQSNTSHDNLHRRIHVLCFNFFYNPKSESKSRFSELLLSLSNIPLNAVTHFNIIIIQSQGQKVASRSSYFLLATFLRKLWRLSTPSSSSKFMVQRLPLLLENFYRLSSCWNVECPGTWYAISHNSLV